MFYRIQQSPEVGDILHAATYVNGAPQYNRVEVLEVFAAVCRVKACADNSEFMVHVSLLFGSR